MKLILRQKIWLAIVIAGNALLWIIPSDVVEQIARDRHTMLGRYSRTQFSWMVGVALISLLSLYVDWSTGATYRRRWFQVVASLLVLIPGLVVIDFLLRKPDAYVVHSSLAYHRAPNAAYSGGFEDKPEACRTYPNARPGYGTVPRTLRTDSRGFRNASASEECDLLVLGDSFAEGSGVSDEHVWPVHLAAKTGLTVYNLGMSGYDPLHYLASLKEYGLALRPRVVLCLLFEGNDFRSARSDARRMNDSLSERLGRYFKQSPVINGLDNLLIRTFGPLNSTGPVAGAEILDWLPLSIPEGTQARYYAFAPKQLRDLCVGREAFASDSHWFNTRAQLSEINELCLKADAKLAVLFAPLTAHAVLPLVAKRLPVDEVRKFAAISYKGELPEPEAFLKMLLERLDARESVVGEWCRQESIPFISLTPALREAVAKGVQVYYTYDQHWTPLGHEVVADAVLDHLMSVEALAGALRQTRSDEAGDTSESLSQEPSPLPATRHGEGIYRIGSKETRKTEE